MNNRRVLISGASIAGPSLAYWLYRYGFDVTLVERASSVRPGGQAVDFKGPVHHTVLQRMGILDAVRERHVEDGDGTIVNRSGRRIGVVPGAFSGGELNIPRGDLARILHGLTQDRCSYIFNDSITSITETEDEIEVTFENSAPASFDIVLGADGIHSTVRRLAFGPESNFVTHLGYYYALAQLDAGDDDVMYNEPGRMAAIGGSKAPAFFVFASPLAPIARDDIETQKEFLRNVYRNSGWRLPELMANLDTSSEFYLDSISRVTMETYTRGRIALVGDSAYGNALGGFGTGLALVGAYVLAGQLARSNGDYRQAFARYNEGFRDYASVSQKVNAGKLLAPSTRAGIVARNALFAALKFTGPIRLFDRPARTIELLDYTDLVTR